MASELIAQHITTEHELPAGFSARGAIHDDLTAVTDLINAAYIADTGAPATKESTVRNDWNLPTFDMARDACVVLTADEQVIAYAEHWNINEPRANPYLFIKVHPDYRTGHIARYLLDWGEARALDLLPDAPPEAQFTLRSGCLSTREDHKAHLVDAGFDHVRSFFQMRIHMEDAPPAPTWPDGITVRTLRGNDDDLYAAFVANEEAFEDHWGFMPIPFETVKHWINNDPDFDRTLHFLAVTQTLDGEEIVATCFCKIKTAEDAGMAWVDDLGVRRPWRRQGIAQALLQHAFGEFYRRGQRKAGLGVDATNLTGALRLYERVGMRVHRQSDAFHKILRPGIELSTQTLDD